MVNTNTPSTETQEENYALPLGMYYDSEVEKSKNENNRRNKKTKNN